MALTTIGSSSNAARRVEDEIYRQGRDLRGSGFKMLMFAALGVSVLILVVLIVDVFIDGWSVLGPVSGTFSPAHFAANLTLTGWAFPRASSVPSGLRCL